MLLLWFMSVNMWARYAMRDMLCDFYWRIHADVIVYIFAHLHTTLRTEENLLGIYWLQTAKKLVKRNT